MITTAGIRRRIAAMQKDDDEERLHAEEDRIWMEALQTIADGCSDPSALARAALRTRALKFQRYYS